MYALNVLEKKGFVHINELGGTFGILAALNRHLPEQFS